MSVVTTAMAGIVERGTRVVMTRAVRAAMAPDDRIVGYGVAVAIPTYDLYPHD